VSPPNCVRTTLKLPSKLQLTFAYLPFSYNFLAAVLPTSPVLGDPRLNAHLTRRLIVTPILQRYSPFFAFVMYSSLLYFSVCHPFSSLSSSFQCLCPLSTLCESSPFDPQPSIRCLVLSSAANPDRTCHWFWAAISCYPRISIFSCVCFGCSHYSPPLHVLFPSPLWPAASPIAPHIPSSRAPQAASVLRPRATAFRCSGRPSACLDVHLLMLSFEFSTVLALRNMD